MYLALNTLSALTKRCTKPEFQQKLNSKWTQGAALAVDVLAVAALVAVGTLGVLSGLGVVFGGLGMAGIIGGSVLLGGAAAFTVINGAILTGKLIGACRDATNFDNVF